METRSPSAGKLVTMVLFALSCVGLLLFLWLSFGGTLPFNPQGYRIKVAFENAQELASPADVRIAGVNVGKVVNKASDPQGNRTIATLELDPKYAPIRQDARAILRAKTLLGETYVEITPGSPGAKPIPDGGSLPIGNVQHAVQLDEIYNAFDPTTRKAFQSLAGPVGGGDSRAMIRTCPMCWAICRRSRLMRATFWRCSMSSTARWSISCAMAGRCSRPCRRTRLRCAI